MRATGLGDQQEWVLAVLQQYEVPLTRFAARLLGDEDAARDVVQHAFLRLCEQAEEELHDRVAQWLFAVCRNKAVDLLRARGRAESLGEKEARQSIGNEPDPAVLVQRSEVYRRLNGLIDGLPPSQREAVALWSEGFQYCQIAEMVGRSEGNVRVLVHRAIKTLRRHPIVRQLLGRRVEDRLPERRQAKKPV